MNACSAISLPRWVDRIAEAVRKGEGLWLVTTPRSSQVLYWLGVTSLNVEGMPGLDFGCCGRAYVQVNGGGFYTEGEWSPNTSQIYSMHIHSVDPSPLFKDTKGCTNRSAYMSPLGWVNISPLIVEDGTQQCLRAGDYMFSRERMEPLNFYRSDKVCRGTSLGGDLGRLLLPFNLHAEWRPLSRSGALVTGVISGMEAVADRSTSAVVVVGGGELEVKTPYYDYTLRILGPGTFYSIRASKASGEALAISLEGALGNLAIASRTGFGFWLEPGRLRLEFRERLRLALGGSLMAARLLHEDQVVLPPSSLCRRGVGHLRLYNSIAILDRISRDNIVIAAYSPVDNGRGEFRSYLPMRTATVYDLEGRDEIPVNGDIVRWPMPFGFCGSIKVVVGGSLFLRLGQKKKA